MTYTNGQLEAITSTVWFMYIDFLGVLEFEYFI